MSRSRFFLVTFLLLFAGVSAFAQVGGTTASLSGTVTSEGKALPGVTVTVTSNALQGVRTAVTGDAGGYVFPALPPGPYSVSFELEGLQKMTKRVTRSMGRSDQRSKIGGSESVSQVISLRRKFGESMGSQQ